MPSSGNSRRVTDFVALAVIAASTILVRLPFLLRADRFFDSDEAVEGLMARHVLLGEYPLFLWGQRYKGVPEVYLASVSVHFSSPVALKAVTLACFVVFVCLNFWLLNRVLTRTISWIATAFLIVCPPSFALWTLSGSADIVMTLIAGAVLCVSVDAWGRSGSRGALVVAAAALGAGLWIQQYILYYAIAIALTFVYQTPHWRSQLRDLVTRTVPAWARAVLGLVIAVAAFYVALGLFAFFTGGFDVTIAGVLISATHPQKMWWIAAALLAVAFGATVVISFKRELLLPALGFLVGYSPAIIGRISNTGMGSPVQRMDFAGLRSAASPLTRVALPIIFGFKSPTAEPLAVPVWPAVIIAAVIVLSYVQIRRRELTPFFHLFLLATPTAFIISGSYINVQSYRYLMTVYAALPVVLAVGVDGAFRASKLAGAVLLGGLLALFAAQQADWYRRLEPDRESAATIKCLDRAGIRTGFADYWLSYKLTFLTAERIILAPTNGVDRYEPYTTTALNGRPGIDVCPGIVSVAPAGRRDPSR